MQWIVVYPIFAKPASRKLRMNHSHGRRLTNGEMLLLVLTHPEIPLHNNAMELAARRRVRKRDVRFGPQSRRGARAWDSVQTISATATTLGVRLYAYLLKRRLAPELTPSRADHIRQRTAAPPIPV